MRSISTAHGFCRGADTTFYRARNRCRTPETGRCAQRAERWFIARENEIAEFENWNAISRPRAARTGDATHAAFRANPSSSGSCKNCMTETLHGGHIVWRRGLWRRHRMAQRRVRRAPVRRRHDRSGAADCRRRSGVPIATWHARGMGRLRIGRKVACREAGRRGDVHDIAKKSVQLPIVHCKASE